MPVRVRAAPCRFLRGSKADQTRGKLAPQLALWAALLHKPATHNAIRAGLMFVSESASRLSAAVKIALWPEFESLHGPDLEAPLAARRSCARAASSTNY